MDDKLACALIAVGVSVAANGIIAAHTFKVIDGYIKDVFAKIGKFVKDVQKLIDDANFNK